MDPTPDEKPVDSILIRANIPSQLRELLDHIAILKADGEDAATIAELEALHKRTVQQFVKLAVDNT